MICSDGPLLGATKAAAPHGPAFPFDLLVRDKVRDAERKVALAAHHFVAAENVGAKAAYDKLEQAVNEWELAYLERP